MSARSKDAVLVIGAGPGQLPLIEGFTQRGYEVLAVDRDPAAPGLRSACGAIPYSTHDEEAVLGALQRHPLAPRLISVACPTTGRPYMTAARCAEMLGLPFPPISGVKTLLDKNQLWRALKSLGLTRRRCVTVVPGQAVEIVELPVVVKPARGGGASEGVFFCSNRTDFPEAIDAAARCSRDGRALVESFIEGPEHKVAGLLRKGEIELLLAGRRTFGDDARRLPIAVALGRSEDPGTAALEEKLAEPLARLCRYLGFEDVPLNVDVIDGPEGLEIIDFDIALGSMTYLLARSTGIDPISALVDLTLRQPWTFERRWWRGAATTYLWISGDPLSAEWLQSRCEAAAERYDEVSFLPDPWVRQGQTKTTSAPVRVGGLVTDGRTQEEALELGAAWIGEVERDLSERSGSLTVLHPTEED